MDLKAQLLDAILGKGTQECHFTHDEKLEVRAEGDDVLLAFSCMYRFDVTFAGLHRVAALLGTECLDLSHDSDYRAGCESCDYGSLSEVTIKARGVPEATRKALGL